VEEAPAVEDAREAPHPQEAVVEHLLPDLAHLGDLGEETVAADVEEEPSVLHRAGVAADLRFLLEDHAGDAGLHERVGAGEPRRAPADDHDATRFCHILVACSSLRPSTGPTLAALSTPSDNRGVCE
jgi:hypothetical protein